MWRWTAQQRSPWACFNACLSTHMSDAAPPLLLCARQLAGTAIACASNHGGHELQGAKHKPRLLTPTAGPPSTSPHQPGQIGAGLAGTGANPGQPPQQVSTLGALHTFSLMYDW